MEDQLKEDFEEFMKGLCSEVSFRELTSKLVENVPSGVPAIGNYFSSTLSSYDHALQMKALFRIFRLSKELEEKMEELHKEEIEKIEEIIRILEREGRRYERERLPYQIFHSHQFNEVKTILRFSPDDIRSHVKRDVEKNELENCMILVGKIGAGKTTSLIKIVERSSPNLVVVVKDNIRAIGAGKLYNIEYFDECVVIWDDIQSSIDEFLKALPILRELQNTKFIGSIRSTDYPELEKDRYFREAQFKKVDVEELNKEEVEELVELLESEFKKPLKDLKPRFVRKVMKADGTPFYVVSAFRNPDSFTAELIESLPGEVTEIWSKYFTDLNDNEKCVMKTLRMIRENFGVPVTEFVRDLYNKAFYGDFNGFFASLMNLENKGWVSTEYFEPEETEIVISKDAQLFSFQMSSIEVADFQRSLFGILRPQSSHLSLLFGFFHRQFSDRNYENAVKLINKAIELDPKYAEAYNNRGVAYSKLKIFEKARMSYNRAIELNPEYEEAYNNRGIISYKSKRFTEAMKDFNRAIELNLNNARAYYNRGNVYFKLKRFNEAMKDFNRAIELNLSNAEVYNNRGLIYYELEKFDEAMKDFNRAIELNPESAEVYNNRGLIYYELEKFNEAMKDFNRAIELNLDNADVGGGLELAYSDLKDFDEVIKGLDEAVELDPDLAKAYRNRGIIYLITKDYERAAEDFKKAGILFLKSGDKEDSVSSFQMYFFLSPHKSEMKEGLSRALDIALDSAFFKVQWFEKGTGFFRKFGNRSEASSFLEELSKRYKAESIKEKMKLYDMLS